MRQVAPRELDQFGGEIRPGVRPVARLHHRLDRFPPLLIWNAEDDCFGNCRMLKQNALDFGGLTTPTPGSAPLAGIPEPGTASLVGAGAIVLARHRARRAR